MSWAAERRFVIFLIIGAVIGSCVAVILIATFYTAPSCADGVQNQGESGIDCGGACAYLCTFEQQPPTVLFSKPIASLPGRTDVIASIENKNKSAAAKNVPYKITLFGADRVLIQESTGTFELPAGATVPIYIPGIFSGKQIVEAAFISIDSSSISWFSMPQETRTVPAVSNVVLGGTTAAPRVTATLTNPSVAPLRNIKVIVTVRDGAGNVIGASQTIVALISSQGQAQATFTWPGAFSAAPVSIGVTPIIPLP